MAIDSKIAAQTNKKTGCQIGKPSSTEPAAAVTVRRERAWAWPSRVIRHGGVRLVALASVAASYRKFQRSGRPH